MLNCNETVHLKIRGVVAMRSVLHHNLPFNKKADQTPSDISSTRYQTNFVVLHLCIEVEKYEESLEQGEVEF